MSAEEKKPANGWSTKIVVMYRDGHSDDCSILLHDFKIIGNGEGRATVHVGNAAIGIDEGTSVILPEGNMALTEKLTLRFEKAFAEAARGETGVRVDLRFCTGKVDARMPEHDSLRADYAGGWKP